MAITNHERVGKAVELLRAGLAPYVEREFANIHKDKALMEARRMLSADDRLSAKKPIAQWDAAVLLKRGSTASGSMTGVEFASNGRASRPDRLMLR